MPIKANRVAHPARYDIGAATVETDAPDLTIGGRRLADMAGRTDVDIELVVRPQGHEFPAVRLMVEKVAIDNHRLRRIVEIVLDHIELGNSRALGDIECTLIEGETVRSVQS